jgi:hypothetical protein
MWAWILEYKVHISKWRPSQHQYKNIIDMVENPPPKNTIKNFKKRVKSLKKAPSRLICESVTLNQVVFFIWPYFMLMFSCPYMSSMGHSGKHPYLPQ